MLGTNFAGWDQDEDVIDRVRGLGLESDARDAVLGASAVRYFKLPL